ncbi:B3 DNA binding domain containing protein [Trema orientale]|uniref:B3 DNA binding domain containing protein n=1 Tax=Trema orientale TaxID=63057 RepID=A0A2P5FY09_TREOI|nr:B3 DNA binding domain containing protein [Trema orientale]
MSTPERCQKALTHYGRTSSLERASRFQPENPFFTVAMKASYTTGRSHFVSFLEEDKSRKLISEETTGCQVTERPSSSGVSRASAAASHFSSTNPYFRVAVRSDHMKHCTMHVPTTFSKRYFDEMAQQQTVILRFGERTWPVKVLSCPSRHMFSAGWSAFARDNFLQPRDVCIFELTKGNELELKVSIFRQTVL